MADPESATLVVNGCLFLNVASFRYLDFEPVEGDAGASASTATGASLELVSVAEEPEAD